jgi:type II secretory pathway predicted ATPase ExeA
MRLKLHSLLHARGISFRDLSSRVEASPAALNLIANRGIWPKTISSETLRANIESALADYGATPEQIKSAWDVASTPSASSKAPHDANQSENLEPEMLSEDAKRHFGLTRNPFINDIRTAKDIYLGPDQLRARSAMAYTAEHGGCIAIIGESGSGKSTLRRDLIETIRRDNKPVSITQPQVVDKAKLDAAHICDAIICDLSVEAPKRSLEAKARQVQRILTESSRAGQSHVLIIEEAHDLHNSTLKYLKRVLELEDGYKRLIGIILIAQPELKARLNEQSNYTAREFIRRCEVLELLALDGSVEQYLKHKFERAEGTKLDQIFEQDAFVALRSRLTRTVPGSNVTQSNVYPLVVQNLVVRCMNRAPGLGLKRINAELIKATTAA